MCLPFCSIQVPIWGSMCVPLGLPWPTCGCEQPFPMSFSLSYSCSGQCFLQSRWVSHITNPSMLHSVPAAPYMTWRKRSSLSFFLWVGGNQQHPDDTPGLFSIYLCLSSRMMFDSFLDPFGCILSLCTVLAPIDLFLAFGSYSRLKNIPQRYWVLIIPRTYMAKVMIKQRMLR